MASEEAPTLEKLWLGGRTGNLAAWSEAKAWAMRVVWKQAHKGNTHGLNTYVAGKLRKIGGGQPTPQAIGQLYEKMDDDAARSMGMRLADLRCCLKQINLSLPAAS